MEVAEQGNGVEAEHQTPLGAGRRSQGLGKEGTWDNILRLLLCLKESMVTGACATRSPQQSAQRREDALDFDRSELVDFNERILHDVGLPPSLPRFHLSPVSPSQPPSLFPMPFALFLPSSISSLLHAAPPPPYLLSLQMDNLITSLTVPVFDRARQHR